LHFQTFADPVSNYSLNLIRANRNYYVIHRSIKIDKENKNWKIRRTWEFCLIRSKSISLLTSKQKTNPLSNLDLQPQIKTAIKGGRGGVFMAAAAGEWWQWPEMERKNGDDQLWWWLWCWWWWRLPEVAVAKVAAGLFGSGGYYGRRRRRREESYKNVCSGFSK
jgi:hypothetical protein